VSNFVRSCRISVHENIFEGFRCPASLHEFLKCLVVPRRLVFGRWLIVSKALLSYGISVHEYGGLSLKIFRRSITPNARFVGTTVSSESYMVKSDIYRARPELSVQIYIGYWRALRLPRVASQFCFPSTFLHAACALVRKLEFRDKQQNKVLHAFL